MTYWYIHSSVATRQYNQMYMRYRAPWRPPSQDGATTSRLETGEVTVVMHNTFATSIEGL